MTRFRPAVAHYRSSDNQWHTLYQHLRGTGILSRRFSQKIGLPLLGELMGLLHDLGKYSKAFQGYLQTAIGINDPDLDEETLPSRRRGSVDHSTAGAQWIWQSLSTSEHPELRLAAQWVALCVASHHSGLIDCLTPAGDDRFLERLGKTDDATHLKEAWAKADARLRQRIEDLAQSSALKDEIGNLVHKLRSSGEQGQRTAMTSRMQLGLAVRFAFSCLIAADRIDTVYFNNPVGIRWRQGGSYHYWPQLAERLESHLAAFPNHHPIDDIRRSISSASLEAALRPQGAFTLSVPTGGGKTLASLRFALHHAALHRCDRIIYVTPFISIIEQNADVVREVLEADGPLGNRPRIVLEHHSNLGAEQQSYTDKLLCDDWDTPVVFTTLVQLLEALFGAGTRGVRRMHQLANAILVFDEIQTLPIRCVHLFNHAINFLVQQAGSTVLLCTATQPLLHRVDAMKGALELAPQAELMPDADGLFNALRRVQVKDRRKNGGWGEDDLNKLACNAVQQQGNCLVIVNTKYWSRTLFHKAAEQLGQEVVYHLSTDMCPAHRRAVLEKVKARLAAGEKVLCVSTQLIEAGVDIDFCVVVRFLAGLDSIAQAAGRCNRNGSPKPGLVYIVNPRKENLEMLPDIAQGAKQAQIILDRFKDSPESYQNDILGRQALAEYYENYFFQQRRDMDYQLPLSRFYKSSLLELLSDQKSARETYRNREKNKPPYEILQSFQSAAREFQSIEAQTDSIIVPYSEEGRELVNDLFAQFDERHAGPHDPERTAELMQAAQQYTVNVYPNVLRKLKTHHAVTLLGNSTLYCLDYRYYDAFLGLTAEATTPMEVLIWTDSQEKTQSSSGFGEDTHSSLIL